VSPAVIRVYVWPRAQIVFARAGHRSDPRRCPPSKGASVLDNPPLREAMIASLASDPRIPDPDMLAVSAQGDVVTLRGAVRTLRERHAAIDDARQVDGVREIDDELELELGRSDRREGCADAWVSRVWGGAPSPRPSPRRWPPSGARPTEVSRADRGGRSGHSAQPASAPIPPSFLVSPRCTGRCRSTNSTARSTGGSSRCSA